MFAAPGSPGGRDDKSNYGTEETEMTKTARLVAYYAQNGSYRLTPKQRRRADKKEAVEWRQMKQQIAMLAAREVDQ